MKKTIPKMRNEMKFFISFGDYEILRSRFKAVMDIDKNGGKDGYRVTSLYFDDNYQTAYNAKISGELIRRKFRIRSYDLNPQKIKLECKAKYGDRATKETIRLTREQYDKMLIGDYSFINESYSDTVLETFSRANSVLSLRPTVVVDYMREAYTYPFGNVRFTFDKYLSCGSLSHDIFSKEIEFTRIFETEIILEVKFDDYLPSHIASLLSGVQLNRQSISKFIHCTDKVLEVKHHVF